MKNRRPRVLAALALLVALRSFHVELPHHHPPPAQLAPPGAAKARTTGEATPILASAKHNSL